MKGHPAQRLFAAFAAILTLGITACAIPGPPLPPLDPSPPQSSPEHQPTLRLIEGQPRGLLMEVALPITQGENIDTLVLFRQVLQGDSESANFAPRYEFTREANPKLWSTGRARFLDAVMVEGRSYRYTLVTKENGAVTGRSEVAFIRWESPPRAPRGLRAEVTGRHVELNWDKAGDHGALVFRREVGERVHRRLSAPREDTEPVFVDIPPRSGVVYGYLVSHVKWSGGIPLIGPPCPELYIESTPSPSISNPITRP